MFENRQSITLKVRIFCAWINGAGNPFHQRGSNCKRAQSAGRFAALAPMAQQTGNRKAAAIAYGLSPPG